jgi:hypothetical protein
VQAFAASRLYEGFKVSLLEHFSYGVSSGDHGRVFE